MVKRRMIDPKIYLKNGQTVTPPPFLIPAAEEPYSGTRQIVMLENDPAGWYSSFVRDVITCHCAPSLAITWKFSSYFLFFLVSFLVSILSTLNERFGCVRRNIQPALINCHATIFLVWS